MTIWCFKVVKNIATHVVLLLETRSWGHVLYRRQVKRMTETLREEKKKTQVKPGLPLYLLQPFCTIFSGALFKKRKITPQLFSLWGLLPSVCLQSERMKPATWAVMFLSSIPWNQRLWWATFFSSVTQARIITVQLLACVAAAGRMASVGRSARWISLQLRRPQAILSQVQIFKGAASQCSSTF